MMCAVLGKNQFGKCNVAKPTAGHKSVEFTPNLNLLLIKSLRPIHLNR